MTTQTIVAIHEDKFLINGSLTYPDRRFKNKNIEGLLLNTRMVQGVFDDMNPETRHLWAYPDTGVWDAERNTREFIEVMPEWVDHGVLAFTLNLQGGSPYGYSTEQPWINSAFEPDGQLRDDYMARAGRIIDRANELGMVVILGLFYFGQEKVMRDADAVAVAVDNAASWVLTQGYRNVLIEINNECNIRYQLPILQPDGVHELIQRVRDIEIDGRRLYVGTSYGGGGTIPSPEVISVSDFLLLHGNRVEDPNIIRDMVKKTRAMNEYRPMPILFNEDDHFNFDKPDNNFVAAIGEYASWGLFDYRMEGESYPDGYQSVPVDWRISSARKKAFFELARKITVG